jgi:CheY-like chemotaxis protein
MNMVKLLEVELNKNMKILIVDDFSTMRRIIKNMLRDLGFTNTYEADDGTTALPMLQNGSFDFLITDWNMPAMSGIDLLSYVRADDYIKYQTRTDNQSRPSWGERLRNQAIYCTSTKGEN